MDEPGPIDGRKVGVIADAGADLVGIAKLRRALAKLGVEVLIIASIRATLTSPSATAASIGLNRGSGSGSCRRRFPNQF